MTCCNNHIIEGIAVFAVVFVNIFAFIGSVELDILMNVDGEFFARLIVSNLIDHCVEFEQLIKIIFLDEAFKYKFSFCR